jgi:hypothetical protein
MLVAMLKKFKEFWSTVYWVRTVRGDLVVDCHCEVRMLYS